MTEFSELMKRIWDGIVAFFVSLWETRLEPLFSRAKSFVTTGKFRVVGDKILSGKINVIGIAFLITMLSLMGSAVVQAFETEGASLSSILFSDASDWFGDFFRTMWDSMQPRMYTEYRDIYHPIIMIPMSLVIQLIPGYEYIYKEDLHSTQVGIIFFFLVFAFVFIAFAALLYKERKGTPLEKVLFILVTYLSMGMISVIDRGNIIIYAVFFAAMFLAFYKSEKWWVREISYVSLAFSVCLKVYPVFLGLLLLREKNFTGALRCGVYWLVLFVTPFLYYGDAGENIVQYIQIVFGFGINGNPTKDPELEEEIVQTSSLWIRAAMGKIIPLAGESTLLKEDSITGAGAFTFTGTLQMFFAKFYGNHQTLKLSETFNNALLVLALVFSLMQDKDWKSATMLTIISITFTSSTYTYSLAFMIFPCLMFLNDAKVTNPLHWIYAALFVAILGIFSWNEQFYHLLPYDPKYASQYFYYLNYANIIERTAILIMTFLLVCEGIFHTILKAEDLVVWIVRKVQIFRRRRSSIERNPYGRGK